MGAMVAIHFVNDAGIPQPQVRQVERALTIQVNRDLRHWWRIGRIMFRRTGWRIVAFQPALLGGGLPNWHGIDQHSQPIAFVAYTPHWTFTASHELLEMLLDPYGQDSATGYKREICDPVNSSSYTINQVTVSNFITPAWFQARSRGPYDALNILTQPRSLTAGGFSTRTR